MKKITAISNLGLALFVIGSFLLLDYSSLNPTGAFLGTDQVGRFFGMIAGAVFLVVGIILFSTASLYHQAPSLERRVFSNSLSSSIKEYPSLVKLTEEAVRDEAVEREMNHLIEELSKGNLEAGLGTPGHIERTKIQYLRGRNGARLYYQQTGNKSYKIVAKSAKGKNQDQVMNKLKEIYKKAA
jgi:hypothetical protein